MGYIVTVHRGRTHHQAASERDRWTDTNTVMSVKAPTTRTTSRDGVNAAQAFFEHNGCVFQEVAQQNDFGKDAYVDLSDDRFITHLCIAVQIKAGTSYRTSDGNYAIPVENHGDNWRRSTVPVFGLVYDPDDGLLRWGDLTGHLRSNLEQVSGAVPISRDAVLSPTSLRGPFTRAAEGYAEGGLVFGLLSESDQIQEDAVIDAWALGRTDARYLLLLRRLILELRVRAVRKAIIALSHATPHPDIIWTQNNWIPTETKKRALESFRWSPTEVGHMLAVLDAEDWERGQLAESLDMLVRQDPESATVLHQSIGQLLTRGDEDAARGAALLLLSYSLDARGALNTLKREHPALVLDPSFGEVIEIVETSGKISLY